MVAGTKLILGIAVCALAGLAMPAHGETGAAQGNVLVASNEVADTNVHLNGKVLLAAAGAETDAHVARCDELTSGYEFRDVLDARDYPFVALEDVDGTAALAACGAALDTYPDHLRSRFHYARAMEAAAAISMFPLQEDPDLIEQAIGLHSALCEEKLAISCHNAAGAKLRMGQFSAAQSMLETGCKMDKGIGAGASCTKLGSMYEMGQIDQKKTLTRPLLFTPWVAAMDTPQPAAPLLFLP